MMWGSSAGLDSHDWQPRSAHVEMAAYVMLAFIHSGNFVEGITLMKWLSRQRNHLGGYGTTQVKDKDRSTGKRRLSSFLFLC